MCDCTTYVHVEATADANVVAAERELAGAGGLIELAARRLYDATQTHHQRRSVLAARSVRQWSSLIDTLTLVTLTIVLH